WRAAGRAILGAAATGRSSQSVKPRCFSSLPKPMPPRFWLPLVEIRKVPKLVPPRVDLVLGGGAASRGPRDADVAVLIDALPKSVPPRTDFLGASPL
ncbi:hypothetical protein Dimus_001172, partial [Dionaea muscipula]